MKSLVKLIQASKPVSKIELEYTDPLFEKIPSVLHDLYLNANGFIALESALLVYPAEEEKDEIGIFIVNDVGGWKSQYSSDVQGAYFFARDIFGGQYGVFEDKIYKLNPESGQLIEHSLNVENWAHTILSDYDYETGWSLARAWQLENNMRIGIGECLIPKRPFSMGGDYMPDNLQKTTLSFAMKKYADLYQQIKSHSAGDKVTIRW